MSYPARAEGVGKYDYKISVVRKRCYVVFDIHPTYYQVIFDTLILLCIWVSGGHSQSRSCAKRYKNTWSPRHSPFLWRPGRQTTNSVLQSRYCYRERLLTPWDQVILLNIIHLTQTPGKIFGCFYFNFLLSKIPSITLCYCLIDR